LEKGLQHVTRGTHLEVKVKDEGHQDNQNNMPVAIQMITNRKMMMIIGETTKFNAPPMRIFSSKTL